MFGVKILGFPKLHFKIDIHACMVPVLCAGVVESMTSTMPHTKTIGERAWEVVL
jgi:hypothetical protein